MDAKTKAIMDKAQERLSRFPIDVTIPPPVFDLMEGEVIEVDEAKLFIRIKFPVKRAFENPFGAMQGGMIATALDNTIGPVALLHTYPNVTKHLDITYKAMITKDKGHFFVDAWYVREEGRSIYYEAKVHDGAELVYTTAKAHHRVLKGM